MILSDGSIVRVDGNRMVLVEEGVGEEVREATVSHSFKVTEHLFEQWMERSVIDNDDFNEFVSIIEEHLEFFHLSDKHMVDSVREFTDQCIEERE
jgi:hypothetical protein